MSEGSDAYGKAQKAIADLKTAVREVLATGPETGMKNVEIGRALGIYTGHGGQHKGHIPRTLLAMMEEEGVVAQDTDSGRWRIRGHTAE